MTCVTCIRWRRVRTPAWSRDVSRYGFCRAPMAQYPLWMEALYPQEPNGTPVPGARVLDSSPLMPDSDGATCLAFKARKLR